MKTVFKVFALIGFLSFLAYFSGLIVANNFGCKNNFAFCMGQSLTRARYQVLEGVHQFENEFHKGSRTVVSEYR
jgi:hypothetical protein